MKEHSQFLPGDKVKVTDPTSDYHGHEGVVVATGWLAGPGKWQIKVWLPSGTTHFEILVYESRLSLMPNGRATEVNEAMERVVESVEAEIQKLTDGAKTPHVHAKLIKMWADDPTLKFQVKVGGEWRDLVHAPSWTNQDQYRLKPKMIKKWKWVFVNPITHGLMDTNGYYATEMEARAKSVFTGVTNCVAVRIDPTEKLFEE